MNEADDKFHERPPEHSKLCQESRPRHDKTSSTPYISSQQRDARSPPKPFRNRTYLFQLPIR